MSDKPHKPMPSPTENPDLYDDYDCRPEIKTLAPEAQARSDRMFGHLDKSVKRRRRARPQKR